MYFFAIYLANTTYSHKFNFYKVKENMTTIIKIILIEGLPLPCEKSDILISVVYVTKTSVSGYRLHR
jgi:hypothetical protein